MIKDIVNKIGNIENKGILEDIYKKPIKEAEYNHIADQFPEPNQFHQADCLYMQFENSKDKTSYKYALVICDVHNTLVDAIALKTMTMDEITDKIDELYRLSKYLKRPKLITGDSQFNVTGFHNWCNEHHVAFRQQEPYAHRQNALVEGTNRIINDILWRIQVDKEVSSNILNRQWQPLLKSCIELINQHRIKNLGLDQNYKIKIEHASINTDTAGIKFNQRTKYIINDGTLVRLMLRKPEFSTAYETQDKIKKKMAIDKERANIYGTQFRSSDHRFRHLPIYIISKTFLQANKSPLYKVKEFPNGKEIPHLLTNEQLQIINNKDVDKIKRLITNRV